MKFKDIISHAISKGWKKEEIKGKVIKNSVSESQHGEIVYEDEDQYPWRKGACQVNLEEIEEFKSLCKVLWGDGWFSYGKPKHNSDVGYDCYIWEFHFDRMVNLSSWKKRREYIISNFKK